MPKYNIKDLLGRAIDSAASDLHITEGAPPMLRIDGKLTPVGDRILNSDDTRNMIYSLLSDEQKEKFEANLELDLSINFEDLGRFRVNVHRQKGNTEAAFRTIPNTILGIE